MGLRNWFILLIAVASGIYLYISPDKEQLPVPEIKDGWWGRGPPQPESDKSIRPYKVDIDEKVLQHLKKRLQNARFGEDLEDTQFQYGFQVGYMKQVVKYWLQEFDWRKQEAELNKFPQFKTKIEGIDVHFLRIKPKDLKKQKAKPLLMVHGWPGSVWEFYKIIPLLVDDGFEVICPSIPGYGFSDRPHQQGFGPVAAAHVFHKLMKRLGHDQFYYQGGDWGSMIGNLISIAHPDSVKGLHLNMIRTPFKPMVIFKQLIGTVWPSLILEEADYQKVYPLFPKFLYLLEEFGYMHIQATKPDTVAFALNDSPVGLAAYILEKFSTWTNRDFRNLPDGGLTKKYTMDELLTNVMIYWVTGTIGSSMRFYKEYTIGGSSDIKWGSYPTTVPAGLASFPNELIVAPKSFAAYQFTNMVQYTDMPRGGHFAAFEEPELLASDIKSFVKKVENIIPKNVNAF